MEKVRSMFWGLIGFAIVMVMIAATCRASTISGNLLDDKTLKPINEGWVDLYVSKEDEYGYQWWEWVQSASSNNDGQFVFSDLSTGEYIVGANKYDEYYYEYYKNAKDMYSADIITLHRTDDKRIEMLLDKIPLKMEVYPYTTSIKAGETLKYHARLMNQLTEWQTIRVWCVIAGPSYPNFVAFGGAEQFVILPPNRGDIEVSFLLPVPIWGDDGGYMINVYAGPVLTAPWEVLVTGMINFTKYGGRVEAQDGCDCKQERKIPLRIPRNQ